MKKIVINLCGVKSKGGITVINNFISQNKSNTLYVLYDNSDLDKYIKNFDNKFIDTKRIYHLFLNFFLDKQTLEKINSYDYIIHFGNFGFKTTIKSYTLIQNILPLVKPLSSLRNFALNLAYRYSFKITDEIIVQQKHVADTIPNQYKSKIIGSFEIKKVKQSEKIGFVTIYEEIKNKNPKFQKELLREIASKFDEKITVINLSTNNELLNVINEDVKSLKEWTNMPPISEELYAELVKEFNQDSYYFFN